MAQKRWYDDLGLKARKYGQMFNPVLAIMGAANTIAGTTSPTRPGNPFVNYVMNKDYSFGMESPAPYRQPAGLGGDMAAQQAATFYGQNLQRMMQQQTGVINREWGSAGRYAGGQRLGAIERLGERTAGGYSDFLARTALQRYIAERGWDEQAAMFQAQLDASDQGGGMNPEMIGLIIEMIIKSQGGG